MTDIYIYYIYVVRESFLNYELYCANFRHFQNYHFAHVFYYLYNASYQDQN